MLSRICMGLLLSVAIPIWSQVEPSATGPPATESEMQTPPPVSGQAYPTATGSETRSNYLRVGLSISTAYDDNVIPSTSAKPIGDFTYSIDPTFTLDQSTPRANRTLTYSPGFTLYQNTSALNAINQNALARFQYRLSPHTTMSLRDSFVQSSNVFNQPDSGVSASTELPTAAVVAPFADQINDAASAELSYQFSANGMIGGSGTYTMLKYTNPTQASGLPNSNSQGGSAFYNRRLSSTQYIGVTYQFSRMVSSLANAPSETQMHTINSFYTIYLKHALTLSVSGGPQHFNVAESPLPPSASWTPSVTASIGWQRSHTNLAASYSRTVTGAGGLLGAFQSNSASASARWQFARTWTIGSAGNYSDQKNVVPSFLSSTPGGSTISGNVSVQHPMSDHLNVGFGYNRIHQSYSGIAVISTTPDTDQVSISVSYQFVRPLGR